MARYFLLPHKESMVLAVRGNRQFAALGTGLKRRNDRLQMKTSWVKIQEMVREELPGLSLFPEQILTPIPAPPPFGLHLGRLQKKDAGADAGTRCSLIQKNVVY